MTTEKGRIGIIGSGKVGGSWAMVFASAGHPVSLYDIVPGRVTQTLEEIREELVRLQAENVMRGNLTVEEQLELIAECTTLSALVEGAVLVLECVPEDVHLKKKLFKELDVVVGKDTIFASCTSEFKSSLFSEGLHNRGRVLGVHPLNSPYHLPLVELVPAPWTEGWVMRKVKKILQVVGQVPVTLFKEVEGFSANRIQCSVMNEIWYQVSEGFLSAEDVEKVMSEGLGMRYAFIGPLETAHIISRTGFKNYCERYAHVTHDTSLSLKTATPLLEAPRVESVAEQMNKISPLEKLPERRAWRDLCLMKLAQVKRELARENLS